MRDSELAKCHPLAAYVSRRGTPEIELAFEDVERIIGSRVPETASRPQWWANESSPDTRHVQCRAWQKAGYEAFLLPGKRVLFRQRKD